MADTPTQPVVTCDDTASGRSIAEFRDYSRDRCVILNSDGADWDCPIDSLESMADVDDAPQATEIVRAALSRNSHRRP